MRRLAIRATPRHVQRIQREFDQRFKATGHQNLYFPLGPEGQVDTSAPHNRLLNTIVNVMGIQSDWFGLPEGMGGATMQGGIYEQLLV